MMLEWLADTLVVLTLVGCAIMLAAVLAFFYQLRAYLALRSDGIALERRRLAHPLPPGDALPHVVVQLPSFNEGAIVERSIANATRLDWPKDKLHIQVCDDSTDATTEVARAATERARANGFDVVVLHRSDRSDFKAGALRNAMSKTGHEYFAILDVDYVSSPDFLRRCMAVLIGDPKVAFIQARPDFLNTDESLLTRAQSIMLDFHYGLEQAVRSWGSQVLPFNGTCGIWRRAAIEAGGGWRGDTVTEDWDLSYRAWLKGWRGVYVTSVTVSGELPTSLRVWLAQQNRWAAGIGEVAFKMLPPLFGNRSLSGGERWGATFPLVAWFAHVMFSVTIILALMAIGLRPSIALSLGGTVYAVLIAATVALFAVMFAANRFVRPKTPFWTFAIGFIPVPFLTLYISWANLRSLPATLLGRQRVFVRTPKAGAAPNPS
ncbi:MAG: glycosyltransferase [Rhizobiales bacterium]|nr:glycosyltransferase [Hyphomicrobiales bacterium]